MARVVKEGKEINDDLAAVEAVLDWAQDQVDFNTEFLESLQERLENGRELTERQREALDNIIEKWGIKILYSDV